MNQAISVIGTGSAAGAPDVAIVEIGIEVLGQSVGAARRVAADGMEAVAGALRERGLGDAALATTGYSINPEYDHRDGRRLRGYRVAAAISARITDLDAVGETIDATVAAGGEHVVVRGLRFDHRDDTGLAAEARAQAWHDARAKAVQLAELADVELGAAIAISEQRNQAPGPMPRAMAIEAAGAMPIEAGELAVVVSIQVEFAIA